MKQIKIILACIIASLTITIILQNTELVETRVLIYSVTLPRAVLLFGTLIIGFLIGALWTLRRPRRQTKV